jgi:hypothetical protein
MDNQLDPPAVVHAEAANPGTPGMAIAGFVELILPIVMLVMALAFLN